MVYEFPAVSHTRVNVWKQPQYSRTTVWWVTLFLGVFGLHHLYLRSPQTMILFLMMNTMTFGYFYFYDLIQLSTYGGLGTKGLNEVGMSSPFGPLGLAQGMWLPEAEGTEAPEPSAPSLNTEDLTKKVQGLAQSLESANLPSQAQAAESLASRVNSLENPTPVQSGGGNGPPSPLIFLLYFFTLPFAPISNSLVGDTKNAAAKFTLLLAFPLYLAAIAYDYYVALVKPAEIFLYGIKRFFPWTFLGMDADGHSPYLTGQKNFESCPPENNLKLFIRILLPFLKYVAPELAKSLELAVQTATIAKEQVVDKAISTAETGAKIATQVGQLAGEVPQAAVGALSKAGQEIAKAKAKALQPQLGGGSQTSFTLSDKLSLGAMAAVAGGGLLLGISRTFGSHGITDSPPIPGTI